MRPTLAIASGKGGVGKNTVTLNLALGLTSLGLRVGVFDADLYGPDVPYLLGIRRKTTVLGGVPIARRESEPYIKPVERLGLSVMSVGFLVADADAVLSDPRAAGAIVRQTFADVDWGEADVLLLDLPPGTGEPQQTLIAGGLIDAALIVTTPQDLSWLDGGRSLSLFREHNLPVLGLIDNMSFLECPHCGERIELATRKDDDWPLASLERLGAFPFEVGTATALADHDAPAARCAAREAAARPIADWVRAFERQN
jgi:ATP-binding protein involved in chromosome partitioning